MKDTKWSMDRACFVCKTKLGFLTIRQYSRSEILDIKRQVPEGMTNHDRVCYDCRESLNKLSTQPAEQSIHANPLFCKQCGKELPSTETNVCPNCGSQVKELG